MEPQAGLEEGGGSGLFLGPAKERDTEPRHHRRTLY